MRQYRRQRGHTDHCQSQSAHRHKPFFELTAGSLNTFAELPEETRRPAELRQDPVHGGNQHKEHHDVHDDFVNSHSPYSLSFVICRPDKTFTSPPALTPCYYRMAVRAPYPAYRHYPAAAYRSIICSCVAMRGLLRIQISSSAACAHAL